MAGEIQLNSTTMATESSGSITAQLDTIRPNTTNGSLTLQGDSSDAGVTGLTIDSSGNAAFAQTISAGTIGSSVVFPAGGTGNPISVAVIVDEKSSGTSGGDFNAAAWRDRVLNTEISDPDSIVSITSNQFTLAAGTYVIEWSCPAFAVNLHQTRLYDVTGATVVATGMSCYADTANAVMNVSLGSAVHTISGNNSYKIQHRCGNSRADNGFGNSNSLDTEIYTIVKISKLK